MPFHRADLEGQQRVDLTRSPGRRGMTALRGTAARDVERIAMIALLPL
jgi:hypothetical protein